LSAAEEEAVEDIIPEVVEQVDFFIPHLYQFQYLLEFILS
jgi:hypothetical protein